MTLHQDDTPPERATHLVLLAAAPAIWMLHFLLSYATAAVWCARDVTPPGSLWPVHGAIAAYTAGALAAMAVVGWSGFRRHRHGAEAVPHDLDSAADRHRFLGFATLLLSGLSAVATAWVALATTFFERCR